MTNVEALSTKVKTKRKLKRMSLAGTITEDHLQVLREFEEIQRSLGRIYVLPAKMPLAAALRLRRASQQTNKKDTEYRFYRFIRQKDGWVFLPLLASALTYLYELHGERVPMRQAYELLRIKVYERLGYRVDIDNALTGHIGRFLADLFPVLRDTYTTILTKSERKNGINPKPEKTKKLSGRSLRLAASKPLSMTLLQTRGTL